MYASKIKIQAMYIVHLLHAHTCTSVVAFSSIPMVLPFALRIIAKVNDIIKYDLDDIHELHDFFSLKQMKSIH